MYKFKWFITPALLISLAACQPQPPEKTQNTHVSQTMAAKQFHFEGSDVRHAGLGGQDFTLLNGQGQPVRLSDFKGKVVALVFGYTHCPDVCPTTLLTYADAMQQLGALAEKVQVLFITVDPARDTTAVMNDYVPAFDPDFIGLTAGTKETDTLNKTLQAYKINVRKIAGTSAQDYVIDHSTGTYLLNPEGQAMVYESHSQTATQLAHDIKQLLN